MRKILVTGANGQLGRCIRDIENEFPECQIIYATRNELNIEDLSSVSAFFKEHHFDYCINTAAYTNVEKAEEDSELAFLINAEAVKFLAETCQQNGIPLVHLSTDYVFDGETSVPYSEEDKTNPLNVYGASKLRGEQHVASICDKYYVIRTSWLYSLYGHNFLLTILKNAEAGKAMTITTEQTGTPTNAKDLANAILSIVILNKEAYGIYHFSNYGKATWYDFAEAILKYSQQFDTTILEKTDYYRTFASRPPHSVLNTEKLRNTFSISTVDWKESLEGLLKHRSKL